MTRRDVLLLTAFLLFMLGFTALILSLVGINYSFLGWMERISPLFALIMKVMMILAGIALAAIGSGQRNDR